MADERVSADPDQVKLRGRKVLNVSSRVHELSGRATRLAAMYPQAGGDGDFGKTFDEKYRPSADAIADFMVELDATVLNAGTSVSTLGVVLDATDTEATQIVGRRQH